MGLRQNATYSQFFPSSQVGQGPFVAPQSCLVSNDNRKRVTGREILYVHDPSAQILPGLHGELQIAPEVPDEPTRARRYSALLDG